MSSAVDIQIVSTPNLARIENFLKDASYRETIEYSANFNTRLCIERRLRLPFLDPQTGVAQNHSQLFMDKRQRMPGFRQGQVYTYPSARWRKGRRQYLNKMYRFPTRPFQTLHKDHEALLASSSNTSLTTRTASPALLHDADSNGAFLEESSSLGAAGGDTSDSKDSQLQSMGGVVREELPKEWYYDEIDMNDMDSIEDPKSPADDEYDYDPRYGSKKRRKRKPAKRNTSASAEGNGGNRRRSGATRGRTSNNAFLSISGDSCFSMDSFDGMASDGSQTATTSSGRRSRTATARGRRRPKATSSSNSCDPPSPGLANEPPSFETAAALVGAVSAAGTPAAVGTELPAVEDPGDLRNYRKYL